MLPAGNIIGHSEWAPTRKTDINPYADDVRAHSGTPQEGGDVPLTPAEWDRLEGTMFRYLLAAQTGRANALVPAAEAEQFAPSSNSQVYELLAYGDSRLESDTAEPHANSIQRVRFEMIQDRAEVAALAKAVGALAEAQGTPIDMQAIKDMVQKTVQDGLAALDLRIVPGETPPPVQ